MPITLRMWFWIWVSFIGFGLLALLVGDPTGIFIGISVGAASWIVLHPLLNAAELALRRYRAHRAEKQK